MSFCGTLALQCQSFQLKDSRVWRRRLQRHPVSNKFLVQTRLSRTFKKDRHLSRNRRTRVGTWSSHQSPLFPTGPRISRLPQESGQQGKQIGYEALAHATTRGDASVLGLTEKTPFPDTISVVKTAVKATMAARPNQMSTLDPSLA